MPPYVSPKDLRALRQDFIPDGDFILPICTNRERFFLMLQALQYFRSRTTDRQNLDHLIDFLEGWAYLGNPQDSPCFPQTDTTHEEEECVDYPTNATIISYAPQNPFTQPDYIPPGYIAVPFLAVNEGDPLTLLGFEVGDVLSGYLSPPILTPALSEGVARFRVSFTGTGVVELHLIKIPGGGMALITHDDNPLTAQTVVLNKDLVQLPPETNGELIIEIPFETPGNHHIDVSFLARFNDELTFLTYGGGLRSVVLCGFDKTLDEKVEERLHKGRVEVQESAGMGIRVDPARCYMLQFECSPGEWVDLLDTRCGVQAAAVTDPADGTPLLPGECRDFDVTMSANAQWLLPLAVSAGDTIIVSDAKGVWHDGGVIWYCVQGQTYALGACVSSAGTHAGDPIESLDHMRLVQSIDGVFYDGFNSIIAVPSGVTDGVVHFQANDSDINDNSGTVGFHVQVCRPNDLGTLTAVNMHVGLTSAALVSPGQLFSMSSAVGSGGLQNIEFDLSPCRKLTVVSLSGWTVPATAPATVFNRLDCASVSHIENLPTSAVPTDVVAQECSVFGVNSDTPFNMTCKVELI